MRSSRSSRHCAGLSLKLVTPRAHHQRGSQASFEHPHGYEVMQALIARGVIGDYREPYVLRFGFTPLYTRFADVGMPSRRCATSSPPTRGRRPSSPNAAR